MSCAATLGFVLSHMGGMRVKCYYYYFGNESRIVELVVIFGLC